MSDSPLFTIITVTFNAESTISPTLRSIESQTFTDFQYLVVDGLSRDTTLDVVNNAGIKNTDIISEKDSGLYDAMNKGIHNAKGQYLIFLNAGDSLHAPDTLQKIADTIKINGYPDITYGQTIIVNSEREKIANRHLTAPENLTFSSFKNGMLVCHQAFIAKRDIAEDYDLQYRYSADYDWCIRCLKKSRKNVYIDDVLIDYLNEGVTTANFKKSLKERYKIMCKYYGTFSTTIRHIKFLFRHLIRKIHS